MALWRLAVDTGGTFTDCLARDPAGQTHRAKVLSSGVLRATVRQGGTLDAPWLAGQPENFLDGVPHETLGAIRTFFPGLEAPLVAAHVVTKTPFAEKLPLLRLRLGTTRGTNALLTRSGTPPALFLTAGLEDLLRIGDQSRPDLFALDIRQAEPLWAETIAVAGRLDPGGAELEPLDEPELRAAARRLLARGISIAAVALLHSWKNPSHETRVGEILREEGFTHVSLSSALSPLQRLLPRARTALANAYLTPVLESYLDGVSAGITPQPHKLPIIGAGGNSFHLMTSAGGLVGRGAFRPKDSLLSGPAGGVVGALAAGRAAGFSDLLAFDMGGTSTDVCRLGPDGVEYVWEHRIGDVRLLAPAVAVESVAAGGGSLCGVDGFGRLFVGPGSAGASPGPACYGAGGPLTLTDVNLLLGRLDSGHFSVPLDRAASEIALEKIADASGRSRGELLSAFVALADEAMADAIRKISAGRGFDPAEHALVAFGGAGGQHACGVAERLGMTKIVVPPDQSLLSARGIGEARIERVAERQVLAPLDSIDLANLTGDLEREATDALLAEGVSQGRIDVSRRLACVRLAGQETSLELAIPSPDQSRAVGGQFDTAFEKIYGYVPDSQRARELESIRVVCAERPEEILFDVERRDLPVTSGPMLVVEERSAVWVADGWMCASDASGALILTRRADVSSPRETSGVTELFARRFSAVAEEMGEALRRTALSTNVKERLDFSCALLGPDGDLVATAAHIPVHLGALGICVRSVFPITPVPSPGASLSEREMGLGAETIVVNHPAFGGSHLPDITLVTPVWSEGKLLGYVASRAHHAELGGTRPGSMPPGATCLAEEGVAISPTPFDRERLAEILTSGPYPTRALSDNLADLDAQLAANRSGAAALVRLAETHGVETILRHQEALAAQAERIVRETLKPRAGREFYAAEKLDDGTPICVRVSVDDSGGATFDFTGSGPQHPGNFNAPPAVVTAAVLYVLRLLVGVQLPLGEGILRAVKILLPEGSLVNPSFDAAPEKCPAVVAGNTEVSQRVVQALLRALNLSAGSQATMNNVLFGDANLGYYETVCGGVGATENAPGASGVHTHMTNTRITDPEVLESRFPVRLRRFGLRASSGGVGKHPGGDGVIREYEFLRPLSLSLLGQSRVGNEPFGADGGSSGKPGAQTLVRAKGSVELLPGVGGAEVEAGDRLILETPGGGGWGKCGS